MKAIRFHSFGDAGVLRYEDAPAPEVQPADVLINLKAAALNHLDIFVREGSREKNIRLPHIPGCDGAGVIAAAGSDVLGFKPGDRVLISPGLSCGTCEACVRGEETFCRQYRVLGTQEDGTYAEYVKLPAGNVLPVPDGLSFEEAAAMPLVFLTAWHMLVTRAQVRPGETVLVQGAGSGVGSAAIQIAKLKGARVVATAGSAEKLEKARLLGADELINYRESDFVEVARKLTGKRGVDVVFEHIGGEIFARSLLALGKGGRLVTCGSTTQYMANVDIRYLYSRQQSLLGSWMGWKRELAELLGYFGGSSPQLKPVVDSVFPLARAREAQERMEERKNFGKVVLAI
jgi:NADPH:quinone reductase-like Zn-dependent oxidoreductase